MKNKGPRHPDQPLIMDHQGVVRFKMNPIVRDLLDKATAAKVMDLNSIAGAAIFGDKYTKEDQRQFAQLIGYSVSGYGELDGYVSRAQARAMDARAEALMKRHRSPTAPH